MGHRRFTPLAFAWLAFTSHVLAQVITTVAGTTFTFPSVALPALNAPLGILSAVATDTKGNVYLSDSDNNLVLRIGVDGNLTVVAGNGTGGYSGDGGPATSAALAGPRGIAVDSSGNIYFADEYNHVVRKVSGTTITTVAGSTGGFSGDNGPATNAQLMFPTGVAVDSAGNLYIADSGNNRIRVVTGGVIKTFAGNGTPGYSGDNVPANTASLNDPNSIAVDSADNLYIADTANYRIRKVSGGIISTFAGNGIFSANGGGILDTIVSISVDSAGNLYAAAPYQLRVTRISPAGIVTPFAGHGVIGGFSGDGDLATLALLNLPNGVATNSAGDVYIADGDNFRIRKVTGGVINTIAGTGGFKFSGDNGPATSASLRHPTGVAVDSAGSFYIADTGNNRVRRVSNGIITTLAGNGQKGFSGDMGLATNA